MKIRELFTIGGVSQSVGGLAVFLDHNNCTVNKKIKKENAIVLHLKRESDGEEGNAYLRVRENFRSIKDQLLNWAFISDSIMGLTLNQLENLDTNLKVDGSSGVLNLHL